MTAQAIITRTERLEHLLLVLDRPEVPRHFSLRYWGQVTKCGSTACVLGTAALDPQFRAQGLQMKHYAIKGPKFISSLPRKPTYGDVGTMDVFFGTYSGTSAGESFFCLTDAEAAFLFLPYYYSENRATHLRSAKARVRWLLKGRKPSAYRSLNLHQSSCLQQMENPS